MPLFSIFSAVALAFGIVWAYLVTHDRTIKVPQSGFLFCLGFGPALVLSIFTVKFWLAIKAIDPRSVVIEVEGLNVILIDKRGTQIVAKQDIKGIHLEGFKSFPLMLVPYFGLLHIELESGNSIRIGAGHRMDSLLVAAEELRSILGL